MTEEPEFPIAVRQNLPPRGRRNWWTALDLVTTHKLTDKLCLCLGVAYVHAPHTPSLSHLLVRPEIRYDHAAQQVFAGGRNNQLTSSADALLTTWFHQISGGNQPSCAL